MVLAVFGRPSGVGMRVECRRPPVALGVDTIGDVSLAVQPLKRRSRIPSVALGLLLAAAAAAAAPSSPLLPGPTTGLGTAVAALAFAAAFLAAFRYPVPAFYAALALIVLDGAIRKWAYNDITVFLLKDFVLLGVYVAIIPGITRDRLARPWWLLVPLGALVVLVLLSVARSGSLSQAAIGVRSYLVYVPLLWVAPAVVDRRGRATALLALVAGIGFAESLFGIVQTLAGHGVLNKMVSGALTAEVTVAGAAYLRPTGTLMQSASFAYLLALALVVGGVLLAWSSDRRLQVLGLATVFGVSVGLVYSAARTLLISMALVLVGLLVLLVVRRRWVFAAAVPVIVVVGMIGGIRGIPVLDAHVVPTVRGWFETPPPPLTQAELRQLTPVRVRLLSGGDPLNLRFSPRRVPVSAVPTGEMLLTAYTPDGEPFRIVAYVGRLRHAAAFAAAHSGGAQLTIPAREPDKGGISSDVTDGLLSRAIALNAAGVPGTSIWTIRIRPQVRLIEHQRLLGHGTGTMSLGAEYANPNVAFQAEGSFSKYAFELGLPGLVLMLWFLGALVFLALRGAVRARGWEAPIAGVGAAMAILVPLWMTIAFASDAPLAAALFYMFAGLAVVAPRPAVAAADAV